MGAGAKSEAIRLVESANQLIACGGDVESVAAAHRERVERALDHGLSRRIDQRIRQTTIEAPAWYDVPTDALADMVERSPGLVVILGAHPNGRIREEATRLASAWTTAPDPSITRKPPAGVTGLLAHRAVDPTPQVRALAIDMTATLFATELNPEFTGRMPTGVERAAREIVTQAKAVTLCPQLVETALDLFDCRVGRYSRDGVRDHHRHTPKEVDRRSQILEELRRLVPELTDGASIDAGARLLEFYERSMHPVEAGDPGAVIDTGHITKSASAE